MREEEQARPWALTLLQALRCAGLCLALAAVLLGLGHSASAAQAERTVVPMGRAVGIKLFSDGVLVVGLSDVPGQAGRRRPRPRPAACSRGTSSPTSTTPRWTPSSRSGRSSRSWRGIR